MSESEEVPEQKPRARMIGVAMRLSTDGFRSEILRGIAEQLLEEDDLPLVVCSPLGGKPHESELIHVLADHRVDGVILYPKVDARPDSYLREMWERNIPVTTVDREMSYTYADFVGTDDIHGGRLAADHLLELGHRALAHLAGPQEVMTAKDRRAGFEQALAEVPGATVETVHEVHWETEPISALAMLRGPDRPTAVFCDSDKMAVGIYHLARQLGLRIPEDLSVVGYADLQLASGLLPMLTSVRQAPYEIGRQAAQQVLDRINGVCTLDRPVRLRLMPELVIRGSTAPPGGERVASSE